MASGPPDRPARRLVSGPASGRILLLAAGPGLLLVLAALLVLPAAGCGGSAAGGTSASPAVTTGDAAIARAFQDHASGVEVQGQGTVVRLLPDDLEGGRHQRFILELPSGQTVLVAHNIDIAPRLEGLAAGDQVAFHGVYEWNAEGGVVHWTHHDPSDEHPAGWLRYDGRTVD
jgi:hypothetical protein